MRCPIAMLPTQLLATQEKRGPTGRGQKFRHMGFISRANAEFVAPHGMIQSSRGPKRRRRQMTSDPVDWHQALARVSGQLVRGEQRVTTRELLTVHLGVPATDQACRRLRRVMRELEWRGPRLMR